MTRPLPLFALASFAAVATLPAQVDWSLLANSGAPDPLCGAAWDSDRGRLVVYGGQLGATQLATMREWDGSQWQTINPSPRPSARTRPAMAFDEARGETVLFGGGTGSSNDTWVWDGSSWAQRFPPISPPPRQGAAMAYDRQREVVVMFGGFVPSQTDANDLWEWDGSTWTPRPVSGAWPAERGAHRMVYADARGVAVLCGG